MKLLLSLLFGGTALAQAAPLSGQLAVSLRAAPAVATVPVQWQGTFSLETPALLETLNAHQGQRWGQLTFHELRALNACLELETTVQAWPLQDRLVWQVCSTPTGTLRLDIAQAWLPHGLLRNKLQVALTQLLSAQSIHLPLVFEADHTLHLNTEQLALITPSGALRFPLSAPTFHITPAAISLKGTDSLHTSGKAPLQMALQLQGQGDFKAVQGSWGLQLKGALAPQHLHPLRSGDKALADWVSAATGQASLTGQWHTTPPGLRGTLQLALPQVQSGTHTWAAAAYPVEMHLKQDLNGWLLALTTAYPPRKPAPLPVFTANQALPIIDGIQYFPVMLKAIREARHSIELESYMFYPGKTTRQLARALCLKAAGLSEDNGQLVPAALHPKGIPVQIIHHHGMSQAGAEQVQTFFTEVQQEIWQEAQDVPDIRAHLDKNLAIRSLPPGVAQIDHRKLLVIDGRLGFTGGLNLGDHYLTADAFHDLMIQVEGPAVAALQQYFQRNWLALGGIPQGKQWAALPLLAQPLAQMAVVATDGQDWSALDAILTVIAQAQQQIRIQHAYLHFAPVQEALKAALQRGVRLELMVPERSDEAPFDVLNAVAARDLMAAAPHAGRVRVWLYQGKPGEHTYMAHSKYLSVDGEQAVVGSTNLVARSLWSPFYVPGSQRQILFNQEIGLWIRDSALVQQLDQALIERDQGVSRPVDDFALMQLIQRRGGASRVLLEQLKGFLS